ncbi:GNAT family N-acetyltransferase [Alkaliphilus hydrothermalis]|uniref:GNAT superfamily N-acetyltransferase n=1 Tax=Alkaliphilus hydrothermalis TaxID=1482730 RepID=A0ABS2NNF0_9FIRM|nr:GNAT family N-acetyltransferase [Alkaliphilus hydrothermalis]MBM7614473.1 GNAT superfamily N-acetyltransferase [Alkaliphilus hydrothermalis]
MKNENNTIKNYLDKENRVKGWPAKKNNQWIVLDYLATKFKQGVEYTEEEINEVLKEAQTCNDHCFFRRELFEKGFLDRSTDGRVYWKTVKLIQEYGETERLIIKKATMKEAEKLQQLYDTSRVLKDVLGIEYNTDNIYKSLTEGDLPPIPNASKDFYRMMGIYIKETDQLMGLLELYHGYPTDQDLYIGFLYCHFDYQKQGFGREVVEYVNKQAAECNFERILVGVNLKNTSGLKFWHKCKFDKIERISSHQEENTTILALEREVE